MIFDANMGLGRFSYGGGYYSTGELLSRMDKLKIDNAVVYSVLSRQSDPAAGNELLLKQIHGCSKLVPAWVLVPTEMDPEKTVKAMRKNNVYAARVFPNTGHFPIRPRCLGPLAKSLQEAGNMVLFIDFGNVHWSQDLTDWEGIFQICKLCPSLPIVTIGATNTAPRNYDGLLAECPNLYLELSKLSAPGEVKRLIAKGYGERLLFGTDMPLSFAGGIIGLLRYEQLNNMDRHNIFGGNLEKLLHLSFKENKPSVQTRKWQGRVIDMHVHHGGWHNAASGKGDASSIVREMNRCGIEISVVTSLWSCWGDMRRGNEAVAQASSMYPENIFGYITIDPKYPDEVQSELKLHGANPAFHGLKFHCDCHRVDVTDPLYEPAMDYANQRKWPVLVHGFPCDKTRQICPKYPQAKFIAAHVGGGDSNDKYSLNLAGYCRDYDNLYLDIASSRMAPGFLEQLTDIAGAEHIVYGSDHPLFDFGFELGRVLYSDLSEEQKKLILYDNAAKLLGI